MNQHKQLSLAEETIYRLMEYFNTVNHNPSRQMLEALLDLASKMEQMAFGTADKKLFLSSLDPGIGKTMTLSKFLEVLLDSGHHHDVGVIVCVSRLTEVERLVQDININPASLAVLTSDYELNELGCSDANDAQILVTTQQMVEKRLRGGGFSTCRDFFYKDQIRKVRIWDETFLPGEPITLNANDLGFLFKPLAYISVDLCQSVKDIFYEIEELQDGERYTLPDFAESFGFDINDVLAQFAGSTEENRPLNEEQSMIASMLWLLSGQTVVIRKDGVLGQTLVDYRDTIPNDLAPMVILDASGRVRETYTDLELTRSSLVRLKSAMKRYEPLTLNVWRQGGGKDAWYRNRDLLIEGIVKTIKHKPDESWLVVGHRPDNRIGDIEEDIREQLNDDEQVSFITWGNHMATNKFRDVQNIILAGTLFYRPSY